MKKFWNFIRDEDGGRVLRLEGPVDEDNFWGDEVTPSAFREELEAEEGDVTVWINSPGGNVFAAAEIYTMLCEHKGKITVKIDAIAASAASVIAMAGDRVLMSPVAMLMVHDPMTIAMGNAKDMEKAITTLNEVKASIINAYQRKTGLSRNRISRLMEDETWMNAKKAVELGFADEILFAKDRPEAEETDEPEEEKEDVEEKIEDCWQPYSTKAMGQRVLNRLVSAAEVPSVADEEPVDAEGGQAYVDEAEAGVNDAVPQADTILTGDTPVEDKAAPADAGKADDPDEDEDPEEEKEPEPDGPDEPGEPEEEGGPDDPDEEDDKKPGKPSDAVPEKPVIGMDGRAEDGSMPYELLKKQLEFLR